MKKAYSLFTVAGWAWYQPAGSKNEDDQYELDFEYTVAGDGDARSACDFVEKNLVEKNVQANVLDDDGNETGKTRTDKLASVYFSRVERTGELDGC